MVFDADGLNALSLRPDVIPREPKQPGRVFTPHPGEFARLSGLSMKEIQSRREEVAAEFSRRHHIVLVLKGHGTVITDGVETHVNPTGNSGLATGGAGDVLTGLITALLAQHQTPLDAARLGVWLHGRAADIAVEELSNPGLIASDLPRYVAKAFRDL